MIKILSLIDDLDNPSNSLQSRHGLSFYIETNNHKILFDVGPDDTFIKNAEKLKINLLDIDIVIISHGHYDHADGLKYLLNINKKAKIYIKKEAFEEYFSYRNNNYKYIGINKNIIKNERFVFTTNFYEIEKNLILFSSPKLNKPLSTLNKELFKMENGSYVNDNFNHEQYLIIKNELNNILVSGCSHNGIINIFNSSPITNIKYIFGGFHLWNHSTNDYESKNELNNIIHFVKNNNLICYVSHCTGYTPYSYIKSSLENNFFYFYIGNLIKI